MRRLLTTALIGMLCVAALGLGAFWLLPRQPASISSIPADAFLMTVESVHDGDTLRARVSETNPIVRADEPTRVRLIGVDTPEISPELECGGSEATASLTALLPPGSSFWAAPDDEVLDRYGRHLLYAWTTDGTFVNAELVAQGNARVMIFAPNTRHETLLRDLEAEAAGAQRGLWGSC